MAEEEDKALPIFLEAAKRGNKDQLEEALAENPSDLKLTDGNGNSALHWAANGGHEDCVVFLVQKGLDVNATNKYGDTPLHKAAWRNALKVAQFLVQNGANPSREILNHDNKSPVELARTVDMKRIVAPIPKVEEEDHDFEQEDEDSD